MIPWIGISEEAILPDYVCKGRILESGKTRAGMATGKSIYVAGIR